MEPITQRAPAGRYRFDYRVWGWRRTEGLETWPALIAMNRPEPILSAPRIQMDRQQDAQLGRTHAARGLDTTR